MNGAQLLVLSALFLGVLCIIFVWSQHTESKRARSAVLGLVRMCATCAATYLKDGVPTPMYRLPEAELWAATLRMSFAAYVPIHDLVAIHLFIVDVAAFNRCLDDMGDEPDGHEIARCRLKAGNIALRRFRAIENALTR